MSRDLFFCWNSVPDMVVRELEDTDASEPNARVEVRRHSYHEYKIFKRRWQEAAKEDESWVDPYPYSWNYSII
ncbi:hypothetical protein QVD17_41760 [Tagetes erecta]|uniref:Uncharacterized protein n=1 Tax=Tagetes erecta TaxID=13708 RepID=A0AAD8JMQ0_TARER|nr:hypothetical protein QVD17_41760 [Tagetes erecta]